MPDPEPPSTEEQVRRLLADARHEEPMPADVVDRLDRVLADLHGESRRTPAPADLAARRRGRLLRNGLVAAAAVVVLGVAVSQVDLSGQREDGGSADSSAGSAAQESAPDKEADADQLDAGAQPPVLSSEDFDERARRIGRHPLGSSLADAPRAWCDDPGWGTGERIPVHYEGERGVLVLRPPADGSRTVDLYLCGGTTTPARSTTIPAR